MQRDKKVGLALAILLCSIVGAFFIRDDAPRGNAPELKNPQRLDSTIAQGDKLPYSEPDSRRSNGNTPRNDRNSRPWEIPDYLNPDADRAGSTRKKNTSKDPLDQRPWSPDSSGTVVLTPPTDDESPAVPMPEHNKEWAVRPKNGDALALKNGETSSNGSNNLRNHVVVAGETLSSIAGKYLGTQARYLDIFQANRDQLKSPDDLKVGMKLNIPNRNAEPKPNSQTTNIDRASPSSNKPTRQLPDPANNKVTDKSKLPDNAIESPSKKVQFKPSKTGPAIRRSADNGVTPQGKSLTQTPPQDVLEVDDGILAELEKTTELRAIAANEKTTGTPSAPRVAQADRDDAFSTASESSPPVAPAVEEPAGEKK